MGVRRAVREIGTALSSVVLDHGREPVFSDTFSSASSFDNAPRSPQIFTAVVIVWAARTGTEQTSADRKRVLTWRGAVV